MVDDVGAEVATGKDLHALQARLHERLRATLSSAGQGIERTGLRDWDDLAELPRTVSTTRAGHTVTGYPALQDDGTSVSVRVHESAHAQARAMRAGTRRLLRLTTPSPLAPVVRGLDNRTKLALAHSPYPSVPALLEDCADCACDALVAAAGGPVWDAAGFARLRDLVRADLVPATGEVVAQVADILASAYEARLRLDAVSAAGVAAARDDVERQLDELVSPGFVSRIGRDRLPDVGRYLTGVRQRLDRLADDPRRDLARLDEILDVLMAYEQIRDALPADTPPPPSWTRHGGCSRSCGSGCSPRRCVPRGPRRSSGYARRSTQWRRCGRPADPATSCGRRRTAGQGVLPARRMTSVSARRAGR